MDFIIYETLKTRPFTSVRVMTNLLGFEYERVRTSLIRLEQLKLICVDDTSYPKTYYIEDD